MMNTESNCGIYVATAPNGRRYVGRSKNLTARIGAHKWALRRGAHHNSELQHVANKHGTDAIKFDRVFFCAESELELYEQAFIDSIGEMNTATAARGGNGVNKGRKMSDEQRDKLRAAWVERRKNYATSDETRERLRQTQLGRPKTEEAKRKLSEARKGMKFSDEHRAAISEANRRRSPESRARGVATRRARAGGANG